MGDFDHLLNWKLKRGSHKFPGPDGGTCINEAALVAAGFAYKQITHVSQMPKCFSRPISHLALSLNDQASDKERQRLLPYVTRLACADKPTIEYEREAYIRRHTEFDYTCYLGDTVPFLFPIRILPFNKGLAALEGALAIGRQADPLGAAKVQVRMDSARAGWSVPARVDASASGKPFVSKVKSWLTMKEMEAMA